MFQVRGIAPPTNVSSLYAPFPRATVTLKGQVHLGDNFFFNWYGWAFRITRSATWNCRGLNLKLYLYSTLFFKASALILASSLTSSSRSRFTYLSSLDSSTTKFWKRGEFSWISTGIIASEPYTKLKGVSLVVDWE